MTLLMVLPKPTRRERRRTRPANMPPMPKMTELKSSEERKRPTKAAVPTLLRMAHHDRGTPPRRKACHGGRWGIG